MATDSTPSPTPTPDAEAAFNDYVSLGEGRSLRKLWDRYQSDANPTPTKRLKTLKDWSARYGWQARIRQAETDASEEKLRLAAMYDADTFLKTSRELNKRADFTYAVPLDELVRMRESVRKPQPRSGVSVNVTVELQRLAEQLAADLGIAPDELLADAKALAERAPKGYQA